MQAGRRAAVLGVNTSCVNRLTTEEPRWFCKGSVVTYYTFSNLQDQRQIILQSTRLSRSRGSPISIDLQMTVNPKAGSVLAVLVRLQCCSSQILRMTEALLEGWAALFHKKFPRSVFWWWWWRVLSNTLLRCVRLGWFLIWQRAIHIIYKPLRRLRCSVWKNLHRLQYVSLPSYSGVSVTFPNKPMDTAYIIVLPFCCLWCPLCADSHYPLPSGKPFHACWHKKSSLLSRTQQMGDFWEW